APASCSCPLSSLTPSLPPAPSPLSLHDALPISKAYQLVGASGTIVPGDSVVAYDGADVSRAAMIGRTVADSTGAFGTFAIESGKIGRASCRERGEISGRGGE